MAVTKLRAKPSEHNARHQLRAALRAAKAAHAAVARQKQAVTRMLSQIVEAEEKIPALEKAVKKAEQAHIDAVAEAAVMEKPKPASTVAEAQASLAFAQDHIATLRQARKLLESEIPNWEAEALAADTEVERLISSIIADYVQILIKEAEDLARRLVPYKAALMAFVKDHSDRPTQYHLMDAYDKSAPAPR